MEKWMVAAKRADFKGSENGLALIRLQRGLSATVM